MESSRPDHDWIQLDRTCLWHPYTQMLTAPPPIAVERAEGIYLFTANDRRILDGISSWWVNIHGHSHPRLNRALEKQVRNLSQVIFAGFTHEPAARLAAQLVERSPARLTRVFFSDDGSTAVEVALKMAYQYWQNRGETQRNLFVALENAYHGDTVGTMSVGDVKAFHSVFKDLFFEVCRIGRHDPVEEIFSREGHRVAAVIVEPILQGAGGMIIWPSDLLRELRELTDQYDIPLIADEVFTGFGRTGKMFACEHAGIEPDLMCLSKALTGGYLPLGATLVSEKVYEAFLSKDRRQTFFHGHSFTGNALSCAVALESLALFDEEDRLQRIGELEQLFSERLEHLLEIPAVKTVRGLGALAVAELEPKNQAGYLDEIGPRLGEAFLKRDILLRPLGNVLYFLPPYVITDEEVHRVFDTIEEVLRVEL